MVNIIKREVEVGGKLMMVLSSKWGDEEYEYSRRDWLYMSQVLAGVDEVTAYRSVFDEGESADAIKVYAKGARIKLLKNYMLEEGGFDMGAVMAKHSELMNSDDKKVALKAVELAYERLEKKAKLSSAKDIDDLARERVDRILAADAQIIEQTPTEPKWTPFDDEIPY